MFAVNNLRPVIEPTEEFLAEATSNVQIPNYTFGIPIYEYCIRGVAIHSCPPWTRALSSLTGMYVMVNRLITNGIPFD